MEGVLALVKAHAERMVDRQPGDGEAGIEDPESEGESGGIGVGQANQDERDHGRAPDDMDRGVQRVRVGKPLRKLVAGEAERIEQERGRALAEQAGAEQPEEDLRAAVHAIARGRSRNAPASVSMAIPRPSPTPQIQGADPDTKRSRWISDARAIRTITVSGMSVHGSPAWRRRSTAARPAPSANAMKIAA